ncbi:uncharacterized protein MELLADRAFT_113008 [Melampsora larici-populina 98AG31]|uniref:F-box domain-containing protein n=1 Tax=Melampsora larici-populina (strain 98AG31 / pathotype 3-4-7) TaxID=747676 RepID=F4S8E4_MELLP|nr:uncharacterized protein MELLADRAFT_113008 [Melampsora larici-populina 98AG31]EGF99084.1 hypothetical protein MELLADRAFT_113008 [Melampsora larici-populina 98AG31]
MINVHSASLRLFNKSSIIMPASPHLPVEIVERIIACFHDDMLRAPADPTNSADTPFLHQTSINRLLSLRLLGRSWAIAIPPFVCASLTLNANLIHTFSIGFTSTVSSPVTHLRRLCLDRVMFFSSAVLNNLQDNFPQGNLSQGIKLLEYPSSAGVELTATIIIDLAQSFHGLFVHTIPTSIEDDVCLLRLPKLKVIRALYVDPTDRQPTFLRYPIFETVEVIITSYVNSRNYWKKAMTDERSMLRDAPKLKHVVLVTWNGRSTHDPELVALFKSHNIKCHFRPELSHDEVIYLNPLQTELY